MSDFYTRYDLAGGDNVAFGTSDASNPVVYKIGTASVVKPAGSESASTIIPHNLGYVPKVRATFTTDNVNYTRANFNTTIAEEYNTTYKVSVDEKNLTLSILMYSVSGMVSPIARTATFKYYLFREKT